VSAGNGVNGDVVDIGQVRLDGCLRGGGDSVGVRERDVLDVDGGVAVEAVADPAQADLLDAGDLGDVLEGMLWASGVPIAGVPSTPLRAR